ncbi:MAG TPA: hypothetical protein P5567_04325 [Kiritimatiellia bacterium]|nr:hypothetical protein [Kiritimatiellia bacterium]HRZ11664.1 hypothetical protein [Kiritimatiellia bacterium]HSA16785.1 hypothetical protein [Kiritimatiellia bacterium]
MMKAGGRIAWVLVLAVGVCRAAEPAQATPPEPGFVEFVESEIIPMMVETGQAPAAASSPWSEPAAAEPMAPPAGETEAAEPEPAPARRDPFWPVGYAPPPPARPSEAAASTAGAETVSAVLQWDEALKTVQVQGIMKTGPETHVAMVNGQVVGVGDTVSVRFGGREYRWTVAGVGVEGVSFKRVEKEAAPADESESLP